MELHKYLLLLKFIVLLKGLCECFNIDVKRPRIYTGPEEALFGFSVLQHDNAGDKSMLVGAPWDGPSNTRRGDVYKCIVGEERSSNCTKTNLGESTLQNVSRNLKNSHLGMTLSPDSPDGFLLCYNTHENCQHVNNFFTPSLALSLSSPSLSFDLFSNHNYMLFHDISPSRLYPILLLISLSLSRSYSLCSFMHPIMCVFCPGCATYMDIVIVLDGSNSIYPWYEVQNFLSNILSKFHISPEQMQVGVLQYGEVAVHEWSLRDYQTTKEVVEAAKNISRQEGRETRTAYAIHMGCTEAFSPERGAREGATKVMIVVTDGESHDGEELPDALEECEKRNITRYAIAVLGHYIRRQQDPETFISEIKYIASDPDDKYFFNVTDEAALNDIVDALGDRIFTLEGTLGYNESSFKFEMSQIGFSTHVLDDGILFGMVGAYDWDGGVLKEGAEGRIMPTREAFESEFPQELKNHAAYLGYTVSSVIVGDWRRLYVAGAPRFKHKGKVILFELSNNGDVNIAQALNGEQIGSYYGSEVCGLDVDQDGITDVLLVAAPMYLGPGNKEAGRVYIYSLSGEEVFVSNGTLKAEDRSQDARFGYALASAPDLNHDGYTDLLVGAPLEDGHNGCCSDTTNSIPPPHLLSSLCQVNFMLEFEFSCTSLLSKVQMKLTVASDSVEREATLGDNSVQLQTVNCSRSWCVEVVCEVQQLHRGQTALIRVSRRVHDNFFRQAKFKVVRIVSAYRLAAQESNLVTLGSGAIWRETVLEVLKGRAIPISLWILIGSIIGGLLLLALIIFAMWKLGFFTRKQIKDEELED
eukprot:XP_014057240.1 PREDICTED: integrin alpha-10-like [Salmo salar]